MDHRTSRDPVAEERVRIRKIVDRHKLPPFVTGFDVRLGEFDGDPAMWIVFITIGNQFPEVVLEEKLKRLVEIGRAVQTDLLAEIGDRFPDFRFAEEPSSQVQAN